MEQNETRKEYIKPEIIHELELETRAGSDPMAPPNIFELPGFDVDDGEA